MNPVRNWILIGLFFGFATGAFFWFTAFAPSPGEVQPDPAGRLSPGAVGLILMWFGGFLAFALGAVVCFVLWFALSNRDMNRVTDRWFLTPLWTILLFVPLVQFVGFYMMARHVERAQAATGTTGMHPVALFLLMWLILPVGIPLAQLQMQKVDWDVQRAAWWTTGTGATAWRVVAGDETDLPEPDPVREEALPGGGAPGPSEAVASGEPALNVRVRPEVVPMSASGVAAHFFSFACIPLALFGPAGIAAGLAGLYSRERFLDLEARRPGHRGGRVVSRLHWVSLVGIAVGCVVSAWMLFALVSAT